MRSGSRNLCWLGSAPVFLLVVLSSSLVRAEGMVDLWLTPDQQAQRAFDAGEFEQAAERFSDPLRAGAAWYRAGEFARAAQSFGRSDTAESHFNRANALLMQGLYDAAIAAYEEALVRRPDWREASENRELAVRRKARLARGEDDAGGTGGKLAADDYVFGDPSSGTGGSGEEKVEGEGPPDAFASDQLRELWLRRVQTRPADFLAARFARQLQLRAEAGE
ncbi:MAG: tetratricopeptide repeat protein [Deltaproteobacteria bacterium]|jgi:Ca-activated chloride channel family protein|nr:tetratricopeptide repeat protein [Deltaproteobacteria bacterium]MBW2498853.1 tetratricopeptide repeat protein [Deltaproteobacteria bacterium]